MRAHRRFRVAMGLIALAVLVAAAVLHPTNARADIVSRWSHKHQLSLRIAVAEGARFTIRYPGNLCDGIDKTFCFGRSQVLVDGVLGFGVSDNLEIEARFRTGEFDWNNRLPLQAGIGVRAYGTEMSRLRFVGAIAVLADFTYFNTNIPPTQYNGMDVIFRAEEGLHYDFGRNFGFYVQFGESFSFMRNFSATIDGGLGIQVRVP
jgi:hypothetical protein